MRVREFIVNVNMKSRSKFFLATLCLGSYRPIFAESAPGSKVRQKQQILCVLLSRRKICNPILNTPMIVYAQSALHSSEWGKLFSGCNSSI